ncbi:MAG: phage portal protein, partial [Bacilli bacterium]
MSILHDLLALGRGRPRDPDPDPGFVRRKNRTVLKAALQGLTTPFKNYVNYAAFPDRIPQTADAEPHDQVIRRAVHYVNAQLGIQGLVRTDFDRELNDRLARNAIYALCERATIDYFGTAEWDVTNEKGDSQKGAVKWLRRPNPHQTMNMVLKEAVRDTIRYDAGVIVSSLRADGHLGELRAFHGPDFWIEVDRDWTALDGIGSQYYGPWSHGLVKRYWQHSRPGIYIPFEPEEITYLQLYPRTDSMYGTDFLSRVRWQLEYLIDSTKSAGMTYANGIAPGAIWKHPDYTSIEELAERELDIELNHLGPENFGGIIHLIGNESIESYSPTLHDMEWIEGQRFFTEIVLAMFGFSSSEFFQGDVNRATAYIGRNITKSRMLYPLQIHFQNMITAKILPLMEGWEDDWEFKFLDTVDLDDELKRAQINQTKASTASTYAMLGLSVEAALDLAEVDDDLRTAVKEELDDLKDQEGNWTDGIPDALPPEEAEQYYGDAGGEDYQGTAVDGDDAENREDDEDVQKAGRVYLRPGEKPPKGVQVKTGPRGGKFYEATAPSRPSHMGPAPTPRPAGDEDVPLWEKDTPDPIPWKKGEQEKFLGYLRNNSLDR